MRYETIRWDQLLAISDPADSSRILFIVWKNDESEKTRLFPVSKRGLDPEKFEKVLELIFDKRRDIPIYSRDDLRNLQ